MNSLVIIVSVVLVTETLAIQVPTAWPSIDNQRQIQRQDVFNRKPYVPQIIGKVITIKKKRHPNPETTNDWIPIVPVTKANLKQVPRTNYRDDRTHEPQTEAYAAFELPTRPIYPGEGKWAVRGVKHRPFVPKTYHKFAQKEEKPAEGYEVFEKNKALFDKASAKFEENEENEDTPSESEENEEEEAEFTPFQLYTQVRRSENEEHLPADEAEDARLREVVKDSKIQTVYTEEGYEDAAYDHAGHEKNAEEDEGYAEFDKDIEKPREEATSDEEDSAIAGSEYQKKKEPKIKMKKDNFIKTEETKTTRTKDAGDGNAEMEISSELKILATPNNSSKTHKFVKIFPKVYRYDKIDEENSVVAKDLGRKRKKARRRPEFTKISTTEAPSEYYKELKRLMEPSSTPQPQETTSSQPEVTTPSIVAHIPELEFGKNEDSTVEQARIEEITTTIQPQLTSESLSNLELNQAQDAVPHETISSITKAFLKLERFKRSTKYPYYDNKSINPHSPLRYSENLASIPDKLEDGMAFYNQADRIECEPVESEIDPIPERVKNAQNGSEDEDKVVKGPRLKPLGDKISCFKKKYFGENPLDSPFFNEVTVSPVVPVLKFSAKYEAKLLEKKVTSTTVSTTAEVPTTEPQITIVTTPKYTIDLKPKHIYDQIQLLHYLPYPTNQTERQAKSGSSEEATNPESAALMRYNRFRRRRIRPNLRLPPPPINPFRFLTSTPLPFISTSAPPKNHLISEVQYKNEIKPIEQLNVFADVINNIKNSTREQLLAESVPSADRIAVNAFRKGAKHSVAALDNLEVSNSFYLSTTTKRPEEPEEEAPYDSIELLKVKNHKSKIAQLLDSSVSETQSEDDDDEENEEVVLGMMPPGLDHYKTIYSSTTAKPFVASQAVPPILKKMNNFFYIGMKPPSVKQKIWLYSDFNKYGQQRKFLSAKRRSKRSAQRPMYSAVVRNRNKPIDGQDEEDIVVAVAKEDDDYVPHRPKNYHYDEKTGRIVYDKPQQVEEEEYIEVTEAPVPKPTRRSQKKSEEVATAPTFEEFVGPSYVEYIKLLKNNPKYVAIPDPTTTQKSEDEEITTTAPSIVSTPPAFLGVVAKLRTNTNYKAIEDKKSTTTTAKPVEENEEVIEESQVENVQNSPGGSTSAQNFQIFDISEYLPKVKTYSPRTSIDYSKYKTIERPTTRHNLSSRYNSEDDAGNATTTTTTTLQPILVEEEKTSESKVEELQTTTTTTPAPTTRKTRTRVRTTRRPLSSTVVPTVTSTEAQEKPRRTYRRRPTRIRISSKIPAEDEEQQQPKIVTRRQISSKVTRRQDNEEKRKPVEVIHRYDKARKHGGNLRKAPINISASQNVRKIEDKPDDYYKDGKLPEKINKLKEVEEGEHDEQEENYGEVQDEVLDYDENAEEELDERLPSSTTSTAKPAPVIVKDPGKRLYYYAPI